MSKPRNISDSKLREAYKSYDPEKDKDGSYGHFLANLVLRRAKMRGLTLREWIYGKKIRSLEINSSNLYTNIEDPSLEEILVKRIYKQTIVLGGNIEDYPDVVKRVFMEGGYHHIPTDYGEVAISRANQKQLIRYTRGLFLKYNLPLSPKT